MMISTILPHDRSSNDAANARTAVLIAAFGPDIIERIESAVHQARCDVIEEWMAAHETLAAP
jgi:hypothetical protein